jgi:hypothetical protein
MVLIYSTQPKSLGCKTYDGLRSTLSNLGLDIAISSAKIFSAFACALLAYHQDIVAFSQREVHILRFSLESASSET